METTAEEAYSVGMESKYFDMGMQRSLAPVPFEDVSSNSPPETGHSRASVFAQQEFLLILLNLGALVSLLLIQWMFRTLTDSASFGLVVLLFVLRICEQVGEAWWLHRRGHLLSETRVQWYSHLSIINNLLFAGLVSVAANSVDAHYAVLIILPIIAAGFRLKLPGVVAIVLAASALTFFEIWLYFHRNPPVDLEEYFEAATFSLVFLVVGLVVWGLARHMRRNASCLESAIEALEHTRDQLIEEEKLAAVGRLASSMAHEVRNPVGIITSAMSTASKAGTPEDLRQELYGIAAKEAMRLEKVIGDFLSYARPRRPEKRHVSARETLDYVAGLLRARLPEGGKSITVECSHDLEMRVDLFQLHQALINLGLNALEHTPANGNIVLGAVADGPKTLLYVENEGAPIPARIEREIYDPFFTTRPDGTGLGLSISRNICRAHGGDLQITSNREGKVRFTIYLPGD